MKISFYILLLFLFFIAGCRIKKNNDPLSKELTEEIAKKDLKVFTDILKKGHPSLNLYISEKRLDFLIDSLDKSISSTVSLQDFYNKLVVVINEIGCSHTDIDMPEYVYDTLNNRKYFFPYPVIFIENKLMVNATGLGLAEGTEIKKINGEPVKNILDHLMRYNPVEGRHRKTQLQLAANQFGLEYYLCYGKKDNFRLDIIDTAGVKDIVNEEPITLTVLGDRKINAQYYFDATDVDYDFYISEEKKYAYLRFSTFSFDRRQQQEAFENFCSNTFNLIKYKRPPALVIDLRQNTGGKLYSAFLLYSYLAKGAFREYEKVYAKMKRVPYSEYFGDDFFVSDETYINDDLSDKFKQRTRENYYSIPDSLIRSWTPNDQHYDGKVYVIVNCKTSSSASYLATMIKNSGVGKVIGETACGGSYSGNGYSSLSYKLPGSNIRLFFSYAHLIYSFKDEKNTGSGLMPDYFVPDTYESFKNNSDKQMGFLIDSLILK